MKLSGNKQIWTLATILCAYSLSIQSAHARPGEDRTERLRGLGRINLDLTSTRADINLRRLHQSVDIRVGDSIQTINPGQLVTPAQAMAVFQVMANTGQAIVLGEQGNAIGGVVDLSHRGQPNISSVNVPAGVTVVDNTRNGALRMQGDFNNDGTFYAVSNDSKLDTAKIFASNIFNNQNATISTTAPESLGLNDTISTLNLSLTAVHDIVNSGKIISSGSIGVSAGGTFTNGSASLSNSSSAISAADSVNINASKIVNAGLIESIGGNIDIAAPDLTGSANLIDVQNASGLIRAENGSINVGAVGANSNIILTGGDWVSKELNLNAGDGEIAASVGAVTGTVNSTAGISHFSASTENLTLGSNCVTGDPTYANTGSITIDGLLTVNEALAIIAGGDIVATTSGQIVNESGAPTYLIAGANIISGGGMDGSTPALSPVTFQFDLSHGGNVDFSAATALTPIATNGGALNIFASSNAAGNGNVWFASGSTIDTRSAIGAGGDFLLIAGGTGGATASASGAIITDTVKLGSIVADGFNGEPVIIGPGMPVSSPGGFDGGDVTIFARKPAIKNGSTATFGVDGTTSATFGGGSSSDGTSISIEGIFTGGSSGSEPGSVAESGGVGGRGGDVNIVAGGQFGGGSLYVGFIGAAGGSGGSGFSANDGGTAGGAGGDGGTIYLHGATLNRALITVDSVHMSGGSGGSGGSTAGTGADSGAGGAGGHAGTLRVDASNFNLTNSVEGRGGHGGDGGFSDGSFGLGGDGGTGGSIYIGGGAVAGLSANLDGGDAGLSLAYNGDTGNGGAGGDGGLIYIVEGGSIGTSSNPLGNLSLIGGRGGNGALAGSAGNGGSVTISSLASDLYATSIDVRGGYGLSGVGGSGGEVSLSARTSLIGVITVVTLSFSNVTAKGGDGGANNAGGAGGEVSVGSSLITSSFIIDASGGQGGTSAGSGGLGGTIDFDGVNVLGGFSIISDGGDGGAGGINQQGGLGGEGGVIEFGGTNYLTSQTLGLLQAKGGAGGVGQDGGTGGEGGYISLGTGDNLLVNVVASGGVGGDGLSGMSGAHDGGAGGAGGAGGTINIVAAKKLLEVLTDGGAGGLGGDGGSLGGVGGAGGTGGRGGHLGFDSADASGPTFLKSDLLRSSGGAGGAGGTGGGSVGGDAGGAGGDGGNAGSINFESLISGIDNTFKMLVVAGGEGGIGGASGVNGGAGGAGGTGGDAGNISLHTDTVTANGPDLRVGLLDASGGAGGAGGIAVGGTGGIGGSGGSGGNAGDVTVVTGTLHILENGFIDVAGGAGGLGGVGSLNGLNGVAGMGGDVSATTEKGDIASLTNPLNSNSARLVLNAPTSAQIFAHSTAPSVTLTGTSSAGGYFLTSDGDVVLDFEPFVSGIRDLSLAAAGIISLPSAALSVNPDGLSGGLINLEAASIQWQNSASSPLLLNADGTDVGGSISIVLNSGDATIGSQAGQFALSAVGASGGTIAFNLHHGGTLFIDQNALNFAPTGPNGDGGNISLTAQTIENRGTGPIVLNQAVGMGSGNGGYIDISLTDSSSSVVLGGAAVGGDFQFDVSGANAGSINFSTAGALLIEDGALVVETTSVDGNGGEIQLRAQTIEATGGGTIVLEAGANPLGLGAGGNISVEQTAQTSATIGQFGAADFQLIVSGGGGAANGGNILFRTTGDLTVDQAGLVGVSRGKSGGNAGSLTLEAGAGASSGNLLVNGSLSVDSENGTAGSINLISDSSAAFDIGKGGGTGNGIKSGAVSASGKTNGNVTVTNSGGAVSLSTKLNAIATLALNSASDVTFSGSAGSSKGITEILLSAGGDIIQLSSKAKIAAQYILFDADGSVYGPRSQLTVTASTIKFDVGGSANVYNKSDTVLKNSTVGGTLALSSNGTINMESAADSITAQSLVLATNKTIGDTSPLTFDASLLSLSAGNGSLARLQSVGTGVLSLDSSTFNKLQLQSISDVDVVGAFGSSKSSLELTAGNGSDVTTSGDGALIAKSLTVTAGGAINGGDPAFGLVTRASNLTAHSVEDLNILADVSKVTVEGLSSQGDVLLRTGAATKVLTIARGAEILSNGSITLNNSNTNKGSIKFEQDSLVETSGPLGGDVTVFIGVTPPTPVSGSAPANVEVVQDGITGGVFFGTNGISAKSPSNILTYKNANIVFDTGSQNSKAISLGGNVKITADPPNPPDALLAVQVESNLTNGAVLESSSLIAKNSSAGLTLPNGAIYGDQSVASELGARSEVASVLPLSLIAPSNFDSLIRPYSNNISIQTSTISESGSGLSDATLGRIMGAAITASPDFEAGEFSANVICDSDLGLGGFSADGDFLASCSGQTPIRFEKGKLLVHRNSKTVFATPFGEVTIAEKSLVLLMASGDSLAVFNLDDRRRGAVVLKIRDRAVTLSPGKHAVVTWSQIADFETVNPAECFGYRNIRDFKACDTMRVFVGEFSVPQAIRVVKPLQHLVMHNHSGAKDVVNHLMKTTAVVLHLQGAGNFEQVQRRRMAAFKSN